MSNNSTLLNESAMWILILSILLAYGLTANHADTYSSKKIVFTFDVNLNKRHPHVM